MEFSPTTRVYFHLLSVTFFHVQKNVISFSTLEVSCGKSASPALYSRVVSNYYRNCDATVSYALSFCNTSLDCELLTVNVESSKRGRLNNLTDTIPSVTKYPDWLFHIMMKWQFYNFAACERQVLWSLTVKEIAKVQESHVGGTMGRSLLIEPSHLFLLLFFDLDP
jgi:hypothetical protein